MSRFAYPYLRPSSSVVSARPWSLVLRDEEVLLPDAIDDWDYNFDLVLRREVVIGTHDARAQCRLPADAPLALAVTWRSTGSGLFGRVAYQDVPTTDVFTHRLEVTIAGKDVGGTLVIETALVLSHPFGGGETLAPRRAGSVLWNDRVTTRLQGDASQFPIAVVDFSRTSLPEDAAWHLDISGSLESAAMGSLLLLVNERNKTVTDAFGRAANPRPGDRLALSAVYADVARTLVEHALASEEFTDDAEFGDETLGAMLRDLFQQVFGTRTVREVRLRGQDSPSLVATDVQAAVRLFGDDQ